MLTIFENLCTAEMEAFKISTCFWETCLCNLSIGKLPVQFAYTTWHDMSSIICKFSSCFQRWFGARFSKVFRHLDMQQFHLLSSYLFKKKLRDQSCPGPHVESRTSPGWVQPSPPVHSQQFSQHWLGCYHVPFCTFLPATICCTSEMAPLIPVVLCCINAACKSEEKEAYILPYSG